MPLYEYFCSSCKVTFETLRPMQQADLAVTCPSCRQHSTQRVMSLVASSVIKTEGASVSAAPMMASQGGGCCGGACGCHP
jgi:putative FmdB family regulatory protein